MIRTLVLLLLATLVVSAEEVWSGVDRIVAVGDVHGDFDQFKLVLQEAGVIDSELKWTGGETHLVQTGDVPDRGPDTRAILDFLMDLEKQARKAGGYVHALMGNHESMNVYGDLRYVIPEEFASFATAKSEKALDREFKTQLSLLEEPPTDLDGYRAEWNRSHPPGFVEHRAAFGPTGKYGRWISSHNVVIKINDTLFLHGGIGPRFASASLKELNRGARAELADFAKLEGGVVRDDEGPLWYRGLAQNPEPQETAHLETVLATHEAKRIVMGHTVTIGAVMPRFDGRAIMIDVGMAEYYGSRRACLLIEGGKAYAIHRGEKLEIPTAGGEALLTYLEKAAKLDPQPSPINETLRKAGRNP